MRRGQRLHDPLAVGFRLQPAIEDAHEPAVRATADEPAETLLQPDDRGRHHERVERIEAGFLKQRRARGDDRIVRRRERQAVDDDARQRVADDVDAFPKRGGREQYRIALGAEPFEQFAFRRFALHATAERRPRHDAVDDCAQHRVAREQDEGAPLGRIEDAFDDRHGVVGEPRISRIEMTLRQIEHGLARIVERRVDDELIRGGRR